MSRKTSGDLNLNNEQKAIEFLQKIDDWVEDRGADLVHKNDEVERILNMNSNTINSLTPAEVLSYSFILFAHAEYLQSLYNKERSVVDFCSDSIWFIVGNKMDNYGGQYAKWEVKYFSAIKENPLASELNRLKLTAEARTSRLKDKSEIVKRMGTVFQDLGKRRNY